jgi:pyruvate/2-oxoacid:ferredoxin oxidoreductase alpha subunit
VDAARERGIRAGALRVKLFRPFPAELLCQKLAGKRRIAVLDRNISLGFGGVLWGELRGTTDPEALVQNYILGIGGGDVQPELIEGLIQDMLQRKTADAPILLEVAP